MDKDKQKSKKIKNHFDKFNFNTQNIPLITKIQQSQTTIKTNALIQSLLLRKSLNLYQGFKNFYRDAQTLLDLDRQNAPQILRRNKIAVDKDGTHVTPQCIDCGKYNPVYKFCDKCYNVHYCSDGCQIRSKLSHQKECHLRLQPGLDAALQIEIHLGTDLGFNIQVHFQHELRMSLQLRGEKLMKDMQKYFTIDHRPLIPQNYQIYQVGQHLVFKKLNQHSTTSALQKVLIVNDMEKIRQIYTNNGILSQIQLYLLKNGGIMHKIITQVHNNHIHLVYIFLTCQ